MLKNYWVMKLTDLEFIQKKELLMLKEVIRICDKYKLQYFALGGTLLGAVRHEGFIPWDDDLDIGLKRKDYNRLIEILSIELNEPYSLHYYGNDKKHIYPYARIEDARTALRRENTTNKTEQALWLDIFPLDTVPNKNMRYRYWKLQLTILRGLRNLSCFKELVNINKEYTGIKKLIVAIAQNINFEKVLNTQYLLKRIDKVLSEKNNGEVLIGNPMGGHWFKEIFPKEYYDNVVLLKFEDFEIKCPERYQQILKKMYGDYEKLPDISERNWHGTTLVD